jgi:putative heme iron utilization protein
MNAPTMIPADSMTGERPRPAVSLADLVRGRAVAALGTLHAGAPFVSMVPFAVLPEGDAFVIHVSRLAAHTRDMIDDPRVSLLVTQAEAEGVAAQALARVSIQGEARAMEPGSEEARACREAYLARFPEAAPLTGFADFSFFAIRPSSARFVAGFAQASSVTAETLAKALRGIDWGRRHGTQSQGA